MFNDVRLSPNCSSSCFSHPMLTSTLLVFPGNHWIALLADDSWDNLPYTLYPFVHLLPSGNLFIFAGQLSTVFDYVNNKVSDHRRRMEG